MEIPEHLHPVIQEGIVAFSRAMFVLEENILVRSLGLKVYPDGDVWCALYGENVQEGVAGFGDTPHKAVLDFNATWYGREKK